MAIHPALLQSQGGSLSQTPKLGSVHVVGSLKASVSMAVPGKRVSPCLQCLKDDKERAAAMPMAFPHTFPSCHPSSLPREVCVSPHIYLVSHICRAVPPCPLRSLTQHLMQHSPAPAVSHQLAEPGTWSQANMVINTKQERGVRLQNQVISYQ